MAYIHIQQAPDRWDTLRLMRADAQFEMAGREDVLRQCRPALPSTLQGTRARSAPPTVHKVFLSSRCCFNCAYCSCRCSNEQRTQYCYTPRDLAGIALAQAQRQGSGVFITSAIEQSPDYTQELICETVQCLRQDLGYTGYVHAKVMPGADPLLIRRTGRYADRLSVNIEVAKSEGYARIAKQKSRSAILEPMQIISDLVGEHRAQRRDGPAGAISQTTQLMAGSTGEDDRTIMTLAQALYRRYRLNRVYYTAFTYRTPAKGYAVPLTSTPVWRMHRLYQADRLLIDYGFSPDEITPPDAPYLDREWDPKTRWALRNRQLFPIEINRAEYALLIRVPGIGLTSARRIVEARRYGPVTYEGLAALGVSLKKSRYFVVCNGRYYGGGLLDHPQLESKLADPAMQGQQITLWGLAEPD